jgi:hypothetical protein
MEIWTARPRTIADSANPYVSEVVNKLEELIVPSEVSEGEPSTKALYEALYAEPIDSPLAESISFLAQERLKRPGANIAEVVGIMRSSIITCLHECLRSESPLKSENLYFTPGFRDSEVTTPGGWRPYLDLLNTLLSRNGSAETEWEPYLRQVCELRGESLDDIDTEKRNELVCAGDYAMSQFDLNAISRNVATTHPDRYNLAELTIQALAASGRYPDGIKVLEIGSSIMAGAHQMVRKDQFPMSVQNAFYETPGGEKVSVTDPVNEKLQRASQISKYVCVDIMSIYDNERQRYNEGIVQWAICSARPSERNDSTYLNDRLLALIRNKDERITFHRADLLRSADRDRLRDASFPDKYDVVIINTAIHQMMPKNFNKMMRFLTADMMGWNSILIGQDFATIKQAGFRNRHGEVVTHSDWTKKHGYIGFLFDKRQDELGFRQIASFEDGSRCRSIKAEATPIATTLSSREKFSDLITA